MIEADTLTIAGPFLDDGEIRGIYIFNVETIEEAERLTHTDPAFFPWSCTNGMAPPA